MTAFRTSRKFDIIFILVLALFVVWCAFHRVAIGDKIFFLSYHPNAETIKIADEADFTTTGRTLFYRTNPQFETASEITAQCDIERLGCLSPKGQTFILDDPSKPNQTLVTAAHEMLHLAYERLSSNKKDELEPLLDQAVAQNAILGINGELESEKTPEDRRDEAHSLLGTEYKNLPPELETYYSTYFSDRWKILKAAASEN